MWLSKHFFLLFCYDLAIPFQQLTYKALFKGLSLSRNDNSSCSELIFLFLTFVLKMCVCVDVHMHNVSMEVRGQRATYRTWFSVAIMCVLRIEPETETWYWAW